MPTSTIKDFYKKLFGDSSPELNHFFDTQTNKNIGHFNVFDIAEMYSRIKAKPEMPYNRRTYYKISLVIGKNKVEYADKTVDIEQQGILFATPKIPYRYLSQDDRQSGFFCVFTEDFLAKTVSGIDIEKLPIFMPGSDFVYRISAAQSKEIAAIFGKMRREINSDYPYKYDLLRNYVMELIHYGQKLNPLPSTAVQQHNAATRISALFIELLERQFPIENPSQSLLLKTPGQYADALNVHVNHLNKVLKETTGKSTSDIIAGRINQEARILLKQTNWNISEIAHSLGFEEVSHFSNFFKKETTQSPAAYRN